MESAVCACGQGQKNVFRDSYTRQNPEESFFDKKEEGYLSIYLCIYLYMYIYYERTIPTPIWKLSPAIEHLLEAVCRVFGDQALGSGFSEF